MEAQPIKISSIPVTQLKPTAIGGAMPPVKAAATAPAAPIRRAGRPAGGRDWEAVAKNNQMPDFQIAGLAALVAASPLLGQLKKKLPIFRSLAEQKAIIAAAMETESLDEFQAAMVKAREVQGTALVPLGEFAKTSDSVTLEKEDVADFLTSFCNAFRVRLGLADTRVKEYLSEKAADIAAEKASAEAAEKAEADDDSADDDSADDDSADDDSADDDSADDDSADDDSADS